MTNEKLYLLISIQMLSSAVVTLLGIVFLEVRSNARERHSYEARDRRRAERRRGDEASNARWKPSP